MGTGQARDRPREVLVQAHLSHLHKTMPLLHNRNLPRLPSRLKTLPTSLSQLSTDPLLQGGSDN